MAKKKNPGGRPTDYREQYAEMAFVACSEGGFTDVKLAKLFKVSKSTINTWKKEHPKFLDSIQKGREDWDTVKIERALIKLALGSRFTETTKEPGKVVTVDPDTGEKKEESKLVVTKKVRKLIVPNDRAIRFWLKNRQPERWRDTQAVEVTGKDGGPIKQQLTAFPSGPMTLAEWEKQVKELNEQIEADNSGGDADGVLDSPAGPTT